MRFEFVVRSGKEAGRTVAVSAGQTISLGRLKGCDVVVDDEAASRRHCTITAREDVCVVADLQSANGTFVNEQRIATIELQQGDKIRIGSTVIELLDARTPPASAVRAARHHLAQHRRIAQPHPGAARRRSDQARVPLAGLQAQGRSAPARVGAEVSDDAAQGVRHPVARDRAWKRCSIRSSPRSSTSPAAIAPRS